MKALFYCASALLAAASLSGCSTLRGGSEAETGAQVYRSHLGQPIARSQIAVEAFNPADANNPEFRTYAAAVAEQLRRLGWTVVNTGGQSEQVALIDVAQGSASRMGIGVAAPVPVRADASGALATNLAVRIKRRSDGTVFWEGQATDEATAALSPAQRMAAVQRLASLLFQDFPGESGRTISAR
jgi:hypothetical protein